jgi:hypothetical protein
MTKTPVSAGVSEMKGKPMPVLNTLPPMILPDDSARTRKTDPLTSHQAADSNNVSDSQLWVLRCFENRRQLAAFEIEAALVGFFSSSRVRTALKELQGQGRVCIVDGVFKRTPAGRNARVWTVTS